MGGVDHSVQNIRSLRNLELILLRVYFIQFALEFRVLSPHKRSLVKLKSHRILSLLHNIIRSHWRSHRSHTNLSLGVVPNQRLCSLVLDIRDFLHLIHLSQKFQIFVLELRFWQDQLSGGLKKILLVFLHLMKCFAHVRVFELFYPLMSNKNSLIAPATWLLKCQKGFFSGEILYLYIVPLPYNQKVCFKQLLSQVLCTKRCMLIFHIFWANKTIFFLLSIILMGSKILQLYFSWNRKQNYSGV